MALWCVFVPGVVYWLIKDEQVLAHTLRFASPLQVSVLALT